MLASLSLPHFLLPCLEFGSLLGRQDFSNLLASGLANFPRFGTRLPLRERRICPNRSELSGLVFENGPDLCLLLIRQIQIFSHLPESTLHSSGRLSLLRRRD